jgi:hypothetical protein
MFEASAGTTHDADRQSRPVARARVTGSGRDRVESRAVRAAARTRAGRRTGS